ncbi:MAG TPA: sigma-70 family RNA polymerase sigma factor [Micromonosporaceae bacterium]|nr:sigma-70 family RNA polymerase sigma factor [Micromonosporaceae bacterium]
MTAQPAERDTTALVAAAAAGDQAAWNDLVDRFAPLVHAVIRSSGLQRADWSDAHQTVWLRLVEHLDQIRVPAALGGWLATTARNECYRLLRLVRRSQPFDPYDQSESRHEAAATLVDDTAPDEWLLRSERRQAVREGVAQLPARCRRLLAMLTGDPPASYREISERLEIPVGSIGPTQARCLRKLVRCPALTSFLPERSGTGRTGGDHDGVLAAGR